MAMHPVVGSCRLREVQADIDYVGDLVRVLRGGGSAGWHADEKAD